MQDPLTCALAAKRDSGGAGGATTREIARGTGWRLLDIVCSAGPGDRAFEERHERVSVSFVLAGSFHYRSRHGRALLSPGSALLGNVDAHYECDHEHGEGDRCLAFQYEPGVVEEAAISLGGRVTFHRPYLPPTRTLAPSIARAAQALRTGNVTEEFALGVLDGACRMAGDAHGARPGRAQDEARVSQAVRWLEAHYAEPLSLSRLAVQADVSPFHFLRLFKEAVGTTPHQYMLRLRLRAAAERLTMSAAPVTEIAYAVGFEDLSNFTRSFAKEFGTSPTRYRSAGAGS